jgi:hypothetical protein
MSRFAYDNQLDEWIDTVTGKIVPVAAVQQAHWRAVSEPDPRACPQCGGPSLRGDLCFGCTSEPGNITPWAV